MADDSPSTATGDPNSLKSDPHTPNLLPTPVPPLQVSAPEPTPLSVPQLGPTPPPPSNSGAPVSGRPPHLPLRPGMQFTPVAGFQNPSVPTPGVHPPGMSSAAWMAAPGSVPLPMASYHAPPGQFRAVAAFRPTFPPVANGYAGMPGVAPPGAMHPPVS